MAINIISASNSRTTQLVDNDQNAFLLVKGDGSLVTGAGGTGGAAYYAPSDGANVTVQGSIIADDNWGIFLLGGGGSITIGVSGIVAGALSAISMGGNGYVVENHGVISGGSKYSSDLSLASGLYFSGTANTIANDGRITGYYGISDATGTVTLTNAGVINAYGGIAITCDQLYMSNSGEINGLLAVTDTVRMKNTGTVNGGIIGAMASGFVDIENYGFVLGAINGGQDEDRLDNLGTAQYVGLGDGDDTFLNGGTISHDVSLGDLVGTSSTDNDYFLNTGKVLGNVDTFYGDDVVDSTSGTIQGVTDLGGGTDTYSGGAGVDRVVGGTGADTIDLGAGDDVYRAQNADGKDDLDGGDGVDTYNASACTLSVSVDLSAATTAATVGNDTVLNFENIVGGSANDTLTGSDDANRIDGGQGADVILGGDGNDRLRGGDGADVITGGAGRDIMAGGTANGANSSDRFVFTDDDSGAISRTRDAITDFTDHGSAAAPFATGADTIDLRLIDANATAAGNQAFSFNATSGGAFSGSAGSLVWQQQGSFALIYGDVDGDSKADFVIQLFGVHNLLASDFLL